MSAADDRRKTESDRPEFRVAEPKNGGGPKEPGIEEPGKVEPPTVAWCRTNPGLVGTIVPHQTAMNIINKPYIYTIQGINPKYYIILRYQKTSARTVNAQPMHDHARLHFRCFPSFKKRIWRHLAIGKIKTTIGSSAHHELVVVGPNETGSVVGAESRLSSAG